MRMDRNNEANSPFANLQTRPSTEKSVHSMESKQWPCRKVDTRLQQQKTACRLCQIAHRSTYLTLNSEHLVEVAAVTSTSAVINLAFTTGFHILLNFTVRLKQIFNSLSFYSLYSYDLKELTYLNNFRYRFQNMFWEPRGATRSTFQTRWARHKTSGGKKHAKATGLRKHKIQN